MVVRDVLDVLDAVRLAPAFVAQLVRIVVIAHVLVDALVAAIAVMVDVEILVIHALVV